MGRLQRIQYKGAYYHIFNRGVAQLPIVEDDQDRHTFFLIWGKIVAKYDLNLMSYCLMDNHYHFFLQINESNLHKALQGFQTQFSKYFNKKYQRSGAVFQGRYQSRLALEDSYSLTLIRYIHMNPVEAGLVQKAEAYKWSSYGCYLGLQPSWPWLRISWVLQQFHTDPTTAIRMFQNFHRSVSDTKNLVSDTNKG